MNLGAGYRRIWTGNAAANLADGVTFVAMPLLATTITDDPAAVAALSVAYATPRLLSVLGIGVLVDRLDRRRLLHLANFGRAAVFAALTVLVATHLTSMAVLYGVYAVLGIVETISDSAAVAILPQAVAPDGLDRANSQIAGTQIVVDEFIGPPLGGLLFAAAAFAPTTLNAAVFLVAGVAYWRLRGSYVPAAAERTRRPPGGFFAQVREGAQWALRHTIVRTLIVIGGLASVGYMIPFSYLVLYADSVLGLDSTGYGLLLSFSAVGGLAGSAVAGRLRRRIGYARSIIVALVLGAVSFATIALTTNVWIVAVALAAYICHAVIWNVLAASMRQKVTPAAMMGRVGSVGRLLGLGGLAGGAALGGALASAFGYRTPFAVAAAFFAAGALLAVTVLGTFRAWEREDDAAA